MATATSGANPAPLGLAGFGMTTVLLNLHNAGFFELSGMILAMGLCYGGLAQIIAGIMEFRTKNTFGAVAFTSYGTFWWSLVLLIVMPKMGLAEAASATAMAWYLLMWGIFTLFFFFGTLQGPKIGQIVFGTLTILFFLLSAEHFTGSHTLGLMAGYVGIFCGGSALYEAFALILNEKYGRTVMPIGEPRPAAFAGKGATA